MQATGLAGRQPTGINTNCAKKVCRFAQVFGCSSDSVPSYTRIQMDSSRNGYNKLGPQQTPELELGTRLERLRGLFPAFNESTPWPGDLHSRYTAAQAAALEAGSPWAEITDYPPIGATTGYSLGMQTALIDFLGTEVVPADAPPQRVRLEDLARLVGDDALPLYRILNGNLDTIPYYSVMVKDYRENGDIDTSLILGTNIEGIRLKLPVVTVNRQLAVLTEYPTLLFKVSQLPEYTAAERSMLLSKMSLRLMLGNEPEPQASQFYPLFIACMMRDNNWPMLYELSGCTPLSKAAQDVFINQARVMQKPVLATREARVGAVARAMELANAHIYLKEQGFAYPQFSSPWQELGWSVMVEMFGLEPKHVADIHQAMLELYSYLCVMANTLNDYHLGAEHLPNADLAEVRQLVQDIRGTWKYMRSNIYSYGMDWVNWLVSEQMEPGYSDYQLQQ